MIRDCKALIREICSRMEAQAREAHVSGCEIDVSGGVDSAVVAGLAVRVPLRVVGVYTAIESDPRALKRARLVAKRFDFRLIELDLTSVYQDIVEQVAAAAKKAALGLHCTESARIRGVLKSCLRAPIGRFVNHCWGGLRFGTGNRDEDHLLRFFQKGGDGEVDSNWISCLYKSEVWQLAEVLDVPKEVIGAVPSPDLYGIGMTEHTDEGELKELTGVELTYGRPGEEMGTIEWVDRQDVAFGVVTGSAQFAAESDLVRVFGYTEEEARRVEAVREFERKTRHKSMMPPTINRASLVEAGILV